MASSSSCFTYILKVSLIPFFYEHFCLDPFFEHVRPSCKPCPLVVVLSMLLFLFLEIVWSGVVPVLPHQVQKFSFLHNFFFWIKAQCFFCFFFVFFFLKICKLHVSFTAHQHLGHNKRRREARGNKIKATKTGLQPFFFNSSHQQRAFRLQKREVIDRAVILTVQHCSKGNYFILFWCKAVPKTTVE